MFGNWDNLHIRALKMLFQIDFVSFFTFYCVKYWFSFILFLLSKQSCCVNSSTLFLHISNGAADLQSTHSNYHLIQRWEASPGCWHDLLIVRDVQRCRTSLIFTQCEARVQRWPVVLTLQLLCFSPSPDMPLSLIYPGPTTSLRVIKAFISLMQKQRFSQSSNIFLFMCQIYFTL